ncbi:MAG: methylmalonyl Co-A mutase-associated GTPase MeaB, partial [Candidatus Zixiibacteriota bacterium]
MTVYERFLEGDIRALSRIVSFVENREVGYRELLARLYGRTGKSLRIGITGPPGAGKSSLVDLLAHSYLSQGKSVGVIAVDPTSPYTGGALLGDRVRLSSHASDGRFFFRSMATRGATGGLAGATDNVAIVYDAFGFDITLIETVGVGQVELDIINSCDVVVVVLVPESGDSVQTMKAGLMEIAHVFCINKADRPGAERIASELKYALDSRKASDNSWRPPIIMTVAIEKKGIDELLGAIDEYVRTAQEDGRLEGQRRERLKRKVFRILTNR